MPARSPRRRTPGRRAERSARVCARPRARLSRRRARPGVRTGTSARSVSSFPPDAYVEGVQSQNEVQKPRDLQKDVAVFRGGELRVLRHGETHELGAEAEYARPHVAEAEEDREQPLARIPEAVEMSAQSRARKEHQKDCRAAQCAPQNSALPQVAQARDEPANQRQKPSLRGVCLCLCSQESFLSSLSAPSYLSFPWKVRVGW